MSLTHGSTSGSHRLRRRGSGRAALAAVAAVAMTAAAAPLVLAQEPPREVLQTVAVDVGTDGTVFRLLSTDVARGDGGTDTTRRSLDPVEHADELPVRVTTGYVHDGKVGTDLADLDGVDGLVEVDVTVQNTTLRPERFRYDAAGVARDGYALVGTPLTVVASATLPKGSLARLRRPRAGTTELHTTNGVISRQGDATTVQWASLLAPPRLSASTTFTFVEQAKDFRMPAAVDLGAAGAGDRHLRHAAGRGRLRRLGGARRRREQHDRPDRGDQRHARPGHDQPGHR